MMIMNRTEAAYKSWLKDTPVKIGDKLIETDLKLVSVVL